MKISHDGVLGHFEFNAARGPAKTDGVAVLTVKGGKFVVAE